MIFELLRVKQYYKNLLVFLVLIFAKQALNIDSIWLILLGFVALCFISSTNYILNDIFDVKQDKKHPEKCKRPIAAGKISVFGAGVVASVLAVISLVLSWYISENFFYLILFLFFFTQIYTLFLKKEVFLDIISIAINFVMRAISGAFILKVSISPWMVLCAFFLSLFMATGKRKGDLMLLGKDAWKHKKVLKFYKKEMLDKMLMIFMALLFASYSLYSFLRGSPMLITLPIALYIMLRYLYLIEQGSEIVRSPDKFYRDWGLLLGVILWVVVSFVLLYVYPIVAQSL